MKAIILAGGFATRLRPLSCSRPKILLPIVNKPLLQWTYEKLAVNNVTHAVLAVFHQTETHIKQQRIPKSGLNVTYSRDPLRKPLGTGGAIKRAEKHIGHDSPFLALNGDTFADINYTEMVKQHEKTDCTATIALYEVQDPSRFGVVTVTKNMRITRFVEKPRPGKAPSRLINAGTYVFSPKIFKYIPEGKKVSLERDVFPNLVAEHEIYGYVHRGLWTDIGKPEDYMELNRTILDRNNGQHDYEYVGAEIRDPVAFDKNVNIGKGSTVGPYAILGHDITIETNVQIENSIILSESEIGSDSQLNDAIVGEDVHIGRKAKIRKGCIVGDHARIEDNVSLAPGTLICPAREVSEEE